MLRHLLQAAFDHRVGIIIGTYLHGRVESSAAMFFMCGGISHEGMVMLRDGHYPAFFLYVLTSVLAGVVSAFWGGWCGVSFLGKS